MTKETLLDKAKRQFHLRRNKDISYMGNPNELVELVWAYLNSEISLTQLSRTLLPDQDKIPGSSAAYGKIVPIIKYAVSKGLIKKV